MMNMAVKTKNVNYQFYVSNVSPIVVPFLASVMPFLCILVEVNDTLIDISKRILLHMISQPYMLTGFQRAATMTITISYCHTFTVCCQNMCLC